MARPVDIFSNVISTLIAGGIMAMVHQAVKLRKDLVDLKWQFHQHLQEHKEQKSE